MESTSPISPRVSRSKPLSYQHFKVFHKHVSKLIHRLAFHSHLFDTYVKELKGDIQELVSNYPAYESNGLMPLIVSSKSHSRKIYFLEDDINEEFWGKDYKPEDPRSLRFFEEFSRRLIGNDKKEFEIEMKREKLQMGYHNLRALYKRHQLNHQFEENLKGESSDTECFKALSELFTIDYIPRDESIALSVTATTAAVNSNSNSTNICMSNKEMVMAHKERLEKEELKKQREKRKVELKRARDARLLLLNIRSATSNNSLTTTQSSPR